LSSWWIGTCEWSKDRLIRTRNGEPGLNYLYSGLLEFWQRIDRDVQNICRRLPRGR
jgi:hypothetical protein